MIAFEKWVPNAARQRLTELIAKPRLLDADRALLERLASRDAMRTDVWARLPKNPPDTERLVIDWCYTAFTSFSSVVPSPLESGKLSKTDIKNWARIVRERPPPTSLSLMLSLCELLTKSLVERAGDLDLYWNDVWQGEREIDREAIIALLVKLYGAIAGVEERSNSLIANLPLPKILYTPKGHELYFSAMISQCFLKLYGRKFDAVVTALVEVTFDRPGGINESATRARRRRAANKNLQKPG